jgi:hypothetical protein
MAAAVTARRAVVRAAYYASPRLRRTSGSSDRVERRRPGRTFAVCAAWALGSRGLGEPRAESAVNPVTDSNRLSSRTRTKTADRCGFRPSRLVEGCRAKQFDLYAEAGECRGIQLAGHHVQQPRTPAIDRPPRLGTLTRAVYGTLLSGHGLASARFPSRVRLTKQRRWPGCRDTLRLNVDTVTGSRDRAGPQRPLRLGPGAHGSV